LPFEADVTIRRFLKRGIGIVLPCIPSRLHSCEHFGALSFLGVKQAIPALR
jgi:hypothetical protein